MCLVEFHLQLLSNSQVNILLQPQKKTVWWNQIFWRPLMWIMSRQVLSMARPLELQQLIKWVYLKLELRSILKICSLMKLLKVTLMELREIQKYHIQAHKSLSQVSWAHKLSRQKNQNTMRSRPKRFKSLKSLRQVNLVLNNQLKMFLHLLQILAEDTQIMTQWDRMFLNLILQKSS